MTNEYGLDVMYFKDWMARMFNKMSDCRPDELARELARMSRTADCTVMFEDEFTGGLIKKQRQIIELQNDDIKAKLKSCKNLIDEVESLGIFN